MTEHQQRPESAHLAALYRALVEASQDAVIVVEEGSGRYALVNAAAERLLGYTRNELLALGPAAVSAPDELPRLEATIKALQDREEWRGEWRFRRKDGRVVVTDVRATRLALNGHVMYQGVFRDITERQRAEAVLQESEARLRVLTEQMPAVLWTTDLQLRFTSSTGAGLAALNPRPEQVVGMSLREYFGTDDPGALLIAEHRRAFAGTSGSCQIEWQGRAFQVHVEPLHGVDRQVVGTIGVAFDITERKRAEDELRRSENQLDAILSGVTDFIIVQDADGRLVYANEAVARAAGYPSARAFRETPRDQLLQQFEMIGEDGQPLPVERLPGRLALRGVEVPETALRCRVVATGEERWAAIKAKPVRDERGLVRLGVNFIRDITEQKRAERLEQDRNRVLEMVARNRPLPEILTELVHMIERQQLGMLCSVLLVRDGRLYHAAAPGLPEGYRRAVDGLTIGPAAGSWGTAAHRNEPVIVDDISSDPLWDEHRELALRHDLRACWSVPINSASGQVLGTFAMYWREPHQPANAELQLLEMATKLAAVAIEHAGLFATVEQRATEALAIAEVGRALTKSLDLHALLDLIVDHACQLLGTERCGLAIVGPEPTTPDIQYAARRGMSERFHDRMRPRNWHDGTTPMAIAERRPIWSADILHALLDLIVDHACQLLGTERCGLAIVGPELTTPDIQYVARRGMSERFHDRMRPRNWHDGTTPMAIAERRPIWSADILHDSAFNLTPSTRAAIEDEGYRAVLSVPLLTGSHVLGALVIYRDAVGPFSPHEVDLLRVLADQAAIAIENARTFRREQERRRQLEAIRDVTAEIAGELDCTALLGLIIRRAAELVGAASGAIYLWDEASQVLTARGWYGLGDWIGTARFGLGEGVAGAVAERRQRVIASDYRASPYAHPIILEHAEFGAVMGQPILYQDRLIGAITVAREKNGGPFTEQDGEVLDLFAGEAAIAIENARLYEQATTVADRNARLQEVTAALSEALTPAQVARVVVDQGVAALRACAGSVMLLNGPGTELQLVGAVGYPKEVLDAWRSFAVAAPIPLAEAVRTREPILLGSSDAWAAHYPNLPTQQQRRDRRAWAAVPLMVGERPLGAMGLSFAETRDFGEEDRAFMLALGQQCAQALDRARLYEVERQGHERLRALHDVELELAWGADLEQVLESVAEQARGLLKAPWSILWLQDSNDGALRARAWSGKGKIPFPKLLPPGTGATWRAFQERRPAISNGYQEWQGALEVRSRRRTRAVAAAPLLGGGHAFGVLTVGTEEAQEYTSEDGDLLQLFAQRAAQAIGATRLHEQAQRDAATKAVLLEEIHHRVRNNLSTVMTLLELERHRRPAPTLDESLARIRRRIQGIATVHTLLSDQAFDAVDFWQVAAELCRWASDDDESERVVEFGPRARPIELDAKRATALALALNELLMNALKHGVGKVRVSLRKRASAVYLCVRDGEEGPRRPVLTLPSDRPGGRGLRLVSTLIQRELHGTLRLEVGERGSLAEVRFPESVVSDDE